MDDFMSAITPELLSGIRSQFAQIDSCPVQGQRIFFENAGGALTLNSVLIDENLCGDPR